MLKHLEFRGHGFAVAWTFQRLQVPDYSGHFTWVFERKWTLEFPDHWAGTSPPPPPWLPVLFQNKITMTKRRDPAVMSVGHRRVTQAWHLAYPGRTAMNAAVIVGQRAA